MKGLQEKLTILLFGRGWLLRNATLCVQKPVASCTEGDEHKPVMSRLLALANLRKKK
jgi:hypothetical protein